MFMSFQKGKVFFLKCSAWRKVSLMCIIAIMLYESFWNLILIMIGPFSSVLLLFHYK